MVLDDGLGIGAYRAVVNPNPPQLQRITFDYGHDRLQPYSETFELRNGGLQRNSRNSGNQYGYNRQNSEKNWAELLLTIKSISLRAFFLSNK